MIARQVAFDLQTVLDLRRSVSDSSLENQTEPRGDIAAVGDACGTRSRRGRGLDGRAGGPRLARASNDFTTSFEHVEGLHIADREHP